MLSAVCYLCHVNIQKHDFSFPAGAEIASNVDADESGHWLSLSSCHMAYGKRTKTASRDVRKHFLLITAKGQYRKLSTVTERSQPGPIRSADASCDSQTNLSVVVLCLSIHFQTRNKHQHSQPTVAVVASHVNDLKAMCFC